MANLSELLQTQDPEALQKLLDLRDKIQYTRPSSKALESAAKVNDYSSIFSKQLAQDAVDLQSIPGRSAADSAKVFESMPQVEASASEIAMPTLEAAPSASKVITPVAEAVESVVPSVSKVSPAARSLFESGAEGLGRFARFGSKLAGPAALAYEALRSEPGHSDEQEMQEMAKLSYNPRSLQSVDPTAADGPSLFSRVHDQIVKQKEMGNIVGPPSSDEVVSKPVPEKKSAPKSAPAKSNEAPKTPEAQKDYMQDLLSKIYGKGLGDEDLQNAQDQRNQTQLFMNLSKAGNLVGQGLSRGTIKANNEIQDSILKNADQPIQDIKTRRDAKMQGIETSIKASDLMDKEKLRDPASSISSAYRNMALQLNPKLGSQPDFSSMSAEGIKALLPMVDASIKMDFMKMQKEQMNTQKQEEKHNKAEMDVGNKIEQLYSQRGAAGRAAVMTQAADRLNAYANQFKDKNQMTTQDIEMLVKDLGTMMSGGVATEGSSKRLMPPTLSSKMANLVQLVSSAPAGANMKEFVNKMQNAANELKAVSTKYEKDHVNALLDTYKNSLRPDSYKQLKEKYAHSSSKAESPSSVSDEEVSQYMQMFGKTHPELTPETAKAILAKRKAQQGQ